MGLECSFEAPGAGCCQKQGTCFNDPFHLIRSVVSYEPKTSAYSVLRSYFSIKKCSEKRV